MGILTPIRGEFESARALLHSVAEDDDITELVVMTVHKNGSLSRAQFKMTRANLAYASVLLASWCQEE